MSSLNEVTTAFAELQTSLEIVARNDLEAAQEMLSRMRADLWMLPPDSMDMVLAEQWLDRMDRRVLEVHNG